MKQFLTCIFLLGCSYASSAQQARWMRLYGGPKTDFVNAVAVDASGSIYTAGSFEKEATIGSAHLLASHPELGYLTDAYLVRWDSAGNVVWARQMGSSSYAEITSLAVSPQGDIFVLGGFSGRLQIDSFALTQPEPLLAPGFLVCFDASGRCRWATLADGGADIATDAQGGLYLVSQQYAITRFPNGSYTTDQTGSLLLKYDRDGRQQWQATISRDPFALGYSLAIDSRQQAHIYGEFFQKATIAGHPFTARGSPTPSWPASGPTAPPTGP